MGKGTKIQQTTDDQFLFLRQKLESTKEGSKDWYSLSEQINQIIAFRYLAYLNR